MMKSKNIKCPYCHANASLRFAPLVLYMGTTDALRENFSISVIAGLPVTLM